MSGVRFELGVKSDPVEYRYSYPWLFQLLADEGISAVQLGTFFEIYQLPDAYFLNLRREAEERGIEIKSIFTAHRELGGFFVDEPGWEGLARRNYERLIEVGRLVGARSVGSNPGAVYRDRMSGKPSGVNRYVAHMKELMGFAHERGVEWLTIEPMSCLAEPPTLPGEIRDMAEELSAWHRAHADSTARIGYCSDIAHGYADEEGRIVHTHLELLDASIPYLYELHLKNCDSRYASTFGFGPKDRQRGIIDVAAVKELVESQSSRLPVDSIVGYLEIGGPKLGRDYSDRQLADDLRQSLKYLKAAWVSTEPPRPSTEPPRPSTIHAAATSALGRVKVAPSIMCADLCNLEQGVRGLESVGADMLHVDVADGHFVPNLLLGLDVIRQVRRRTKLPMDVHLMVETPDAYIDALAEMGINYVAVHAEACRHLDRTLTRLGDAGIKAGVAINPATPLTAIEYVAERLDFVLLMTVNPGFAGQKLVAAAIRKIADCRRWRDAHGLTAEIMVDGNVSFDHIPDMVAAGADILVAGTSSWFHRDAGLADNVEKTRQAIDAGLEQRKGGTW